MIKVSISNNMNKVTTTNYIDSNSCCQRWETTL